MKRPRNGWRTEVSWGLDEGTVRIVTDQEESGLWRRGPILLPGARSASPLTPLQYAVKAWHRGEAARRGQEALEASNDEERNKWGNAKERPRLY
ncbi:hypothetical protein NDU88_001829 [Pleurodeles waltl]|uniref:Uncharacterized protein n=1 Tax=Pleurodeles waltl TaxID=8319 RepID=A0AAV7LC69_PLEWA|nr:hypothetical protein NDU88_001829 [Pleurodeles waltl]